MTPDSLYLWIGVYSERAGRGFYAEVFFKENRFEKISQILMFVKEFVEK